MYGSDDPGGDSGGPGGGSGDPGGAWSPCPGAICPRPVLYALEKETLERVLWGVYMYSIEANIDVPERHWSPKGVLKDEFPDLIVFSFSSVLAPKTFQNGALEVVLEELLDVLEVLLELLELSGRPSEQ